MTDNPNTAFVVRERVRNGELMQLKALIKEGIDFNECFLAPGPTIRGYTPLHIAAFGTAKPNYDRDIVEAILQAAKKAGKEAESAVRAAKDSIDGEIPLDLVSVLIELRPNGAHLRPCSSCMCTGQATVSQGRREPSEAGRRRQGLSRREAANAGRKWPSCGIRQLAAPPGARVPPCPGASCLGHECHRARAASRGALPLPTQIELTCVPLSRAGRGWTR